MRLAHFSDFHICHRDAALEAQRAAALVDHPIESGAKHLVFSGDLANHGNLKDLDPLVASLQKHGFLRAERLTVVPGNHDIWPFGERSFAADIWDWAKSNLASLCALKPDLPAQRRFEDFVRTFGPAYQGATRASRSNPFPCLKQVGDARLVLLDTTADLALRHAQGLLAEEDAEWVLETLTPLEGPRILVMHHWPFEWSTVDPNVIANRLPTFARKAIELLGGDPDQLARDLVDVNFRDLKAVRRFIKAGRFDAVLCGHLHLGDKGVDSPEFSQTIGKVPVHCMGRSGAVHQGASRRYAYHLVDVGEQVVVRTVLVRERELAAR